MLDCFKGEANIIGFHIFFNIALENWPIVFLGNQFLSFFDFKIPSWQIIVILSDQLWAKNFQNV